MVTRPCPDLDLDLDLEWDLEWDLELDNYLLEDKSQNQIINNQLLCCQGEQSVGLEFCLVYSLVSSSSLCILPWSLFLLSWHLHLAGIRNRGK